MGGEEMSAYPDPIAHIRERMHRADVDYWWDSFGQFWAIVGLGSMLSRALVIVATNENGERQAAADLVSWTILAAIRKAVS
jgi:hypothetical protein